MTNAIASARHRGIVSLAILLRTFRDEGLTTLAVAAKHDRLTRGVWSGGEGRGCPLSCAQGVVGMSRASRFWTVATDRNTFIRAWDAGLISDADVVALVELEMERRAAQPSAIRRVVSAVNTFVARLSRPTPTRA